MDYKEKVIALLKSQELSKEQKEKLENIFPELKESEDEKVKKEIVRFIQMEVEDEIVGNKWISWLEKQNSNVDNANKEYWRGYREGKQEILDKYAELEKEGEQKCIPKYKIGDYVKNTNYKGEPIYEIVYMDKECYICEYQGKERMGDKAVMHFSFDNSYLRLVQKPANKVEPKFKVGDWVVDNKNGIVKQILSYKHGVYKHTYGYSGKIFENEWRLWDITKDAKDGDILFQDLMGGKVFIYNGINPDMAILYSFIISNDGEELLPYNIGKPNTGIGTIEDNKNIIYPATKEQRDLLLSKMKEAGYEWDTEKKELKKIENRPMLSDFFNAEYERGKADAISEIQKGWTEDDKNHMANILNILLMEAKNAKVEQYRSSVESDIDWIYSLKNKVRVQPKQERSDNDEDYINDLIKYFSQNEKLKNTKEDIVIWLKSLKDNVQPKQEWNKWDELQYKVAYNLCENSGHTVTSDWLKSLKERLKNK